MKDTNKRASKLSPCMSYQERLRGYEKDKQQLLATMAHLPDAEFSERLKALQDKWRI